MPVANHMMAHGVLRALPVLLAAICLTALSACGAGGNKPFSKSNGPSGRPPPTVSIIAMNGLPADKAKLLANFIQQSAAKRDVAVIDQDFGDSWKLAGEFLPQRDPDGTAGLVYGWSLRDGKGQTVHQISAVQDLGPAGADPWNAVSPDALRAIAGYTAENLASRLSQLGFATQVAGLAPPSDTYSRAGPNAEKELDYETIYGHRANVAAGQPTVPGATAPPVAAARDDQLAAAEMTAPATAGEPVRTASVAPKPARKAKPGAKAIRGVTVTGVRGSPGKGNSELAHAMRSALEKAGWPVYDKPRPDALNIAGRVDLSKPAGATQKVALAWTVTSPDGKNLGTIRQANKVPAGSLDGGWGQTAGYAAQAGAEGIFELVGKLR